MRALRGLSALLVLLGLVVGVPAGLVVFGSEYLPDHVPSWSEIGAVLSSPDNGSIFLGLLVVVGWVAWAMFAASVFVELPAQLRGLPSRRLPGVGGVQRLAQDLVAAVMVLLPISALADPSAAIRALAPASVSAPVSFVVPEAAPAKQMAVPVSRHVPVTTNRWEYTVRHGDTLWGLAERYLGDGARFTEIRDLNLMTAQPDGAYLTDSRTIRAGWVLQMPGKSPDGLTSPSPYEAPAPESATYVVVSGDSLRSIAQRLLGDEMRWREIFELNDGVVQVDGSALTDPDLILPGWVLTVPAVPPASRTDGVVVVEPGDTLGEIAAEAGLPSWQPIFDLNVGEVQPSGAVFTDPDLIFPGQRLDLPAGAAPEPAPQPTAETPPGPPPSAEPAPPTAPAPEEPAPHLPPLPEQRDPAEAGVQATEETPSGDASPTLVTVLSGGGALLAAGIGAALLLHRRRRYFRRRPGRTLAALPAALVPVEAAVLDGSREGEADFADLDLALRSLAVALSADPAAHLPEVVAARLDGDNLDLRLNPPSDARPPAPWSAYESGRWWSVDLRADFGVDPASARGRLAPYPGLVSVGHVAGRRWLLDLERIGTLRVSGPAQRCEDFSRHLAAELAVNSWSDLLYVAMAGFGAELVPLHPSRLTAVDSVPDAAIALHARLRENLEVSAAQAVGVLDGRLRAIAGDSWMPEILIVAPRLAADEVLASLTEPLGGLPDRGAVAVVVGSEVPVAGEGWQISLSQDGELRIPNLDLTLQAQLLTAEQGADIAQLISFERGAVDAPMPAAAGQAPWHAYTDIAGALRPNRTLSRDAAPAEAPSEDAREWAPAVVESILPQPTNVYVQASAATAEEVAVLAPRTPADLSARIEDDLDRLDRDLAEWWNPESHRPRLTLLGPVTVRAYGEEKERRRLYVEVIAYLATRPTNGATVDEMAAALRPEADDLTSARSAVYRACTGARKLLGKDPDTGEDYLRAARSGPYIISDKLLVDVDLFCQLRTRSAARGRDGVRDLQAALALISGPPFGQRLGGYEWLDSLDHHYTGMIGDVSHLVVTSALAEGDIDTAKSAVQAALSAAPDDVKVLVDAVWVAFQDGNEAEAEAIVSRIIRISDVDVDVDLDPKLFTAIDRARQLLDRAS